MSVSTLPAPVLADRVFGTRAGTLFGTIPVARVRDVALIAGAVAWLWAAGNVVIPLPFTPVPLSLATFAVLLAGAALGPVRAGLATALYLVIGVTGAPMFAGGASGWMFASFGYILGYVAASVLVGYLARRRADRSVGSTALLAVSSTTVIYLFGLPWLMGFLGVGLSEGLALGVVPFLIGDAIKAVAAAVLLPVTWRLLGEGR